MTTVTLRSQAHCHPANLDKLSNQSCHPDHIQTPLPNHDITTTPVLEGPPINPGTNVAIKRTTIPFLAKRQFSRFISTPSPPSGKYGEVPYPRQQTHTPSPIPFGIGINDTVSSSNNSYALSKDSALVDFFRGSAEVTPLLRVDMESNGYFIGWDQAQVEGEGEGEGDGEGEEGSLVGCISETEAGWSRSGVKGYSIHKAWSDFGEERNDGKGRRDGWGWLTI